ncbi:SpoIIE family protein phosphatase [Herbidospora sp. NEAU-GS84]|uniref:histidine kinase n=1 Tax=Herbidospora solisilvae TaxID=2696284 RepID=A0A7C9MXZ1_9ACTN|nr:SpoIIE family protein phosphatase [Herbidospora solisilvae]NAS23551.1 SpoIIE family protein phosphatase [Herbidospora solisilvae]
MAEQAAARAMNAVLMSGGVTGAMIAAQDWSGTALGPVDTWPAGLRGVLEVSLGSEIPVFVFWGPDLTHLYNDAFIPILGEKHPSALGAPAEETWREVWDVLGPTLNGVVTSGRAARVEDLLVITSRHGSPEETYFTFTCGPARDASGAVAGVFGVVRETTAEVLGDRRRAILHRLAERTMTAVSAADAAETAAEVFSGHPIDIPFALIYLLAPDRSIATLAGAAGLRPGGRLSPLTVDLAASETAWPLAAALNGAVVAPCPPSPELPPARAGFDPVGHALVLPLGSSGILVAGLHSGRPLDDDHRTFLDMVGGLVAAALGNAAAFDHERRRAEAGSRFLGDVSHELRTPLTLMLSPLADVLADSTGPHPRDRDGVELAYRNALRQLNLVNELLDFSRADAGAVEPRPQAVDLARLTSQLADLFRPAISHSGLTFDVDCPPLPQPVSVDRGMWEKIVLNLLSNAFTFTFEGGVRVSLGLDHEGSVRLQVADTGTGIPPEEVGRLFERFHQVPGGRSRSAEGSGIGLSLVRELVELLKGSIDVTSEPGVGSVFTVTIPFEPVKGAVEPYTATPETAAFIEEATSWTAGQPPVEPGPVEVLVVDDSADMRAYLTRVLAPHWRIHAVADGRRALDFLEAAQSPPELVLTDVMMPDLDGFALLKAIRAADRLRGIPVIMVSARAGQEAVIEGLDADADDYLVKPFTSAELIARVRTNLTTARSRRHAADRIRALSAVAQKLSGSLQPRHVAEILAEHLVPDYSDGCSVWLPTEDDPEALRLAHLATGPRLSPESRHALSEPGEATAGTLDLPFEYADATGQRTAMLRLASSSLGFDERVWLRELLDVAGSALTNAASYRHEHGIALQLQQSLLPMALPVSKRYKLASRYRAGAAGHQVGGDWYDAFHLPDGRLGLTIGDVIGNGIQAAALMGRVRSAMRAYVLEGMPPARAMEKVNIFLESVGRNQFTTAFSAVYDLETRWLEFANAGHLPPVLVAGGEAELLDVRPNLCLGLQTTFTYTGQRVRLAPGSTLLLYTDGLVERRDEFLDDRLARLRDAFAGFSGSHDEICDHALRAMSVPTQHADDDIALLTLSV